jgi:hypothetical protein
MGEALPVVPQRLVKRIVKGEYVDMAELLKDNLEVERRRALSDGEGSQSALLTRGARREVPDLLSWLQCYSMFAAVTCANNPAKTREMWAYQSLMIGEARRCGGRGWAMYDSAFRQQMASRGDGDFASLNQSLYSTTFLAYGGRGKFCGTCMMSDHAQEECALNPTRALPIVQIREQEGRRDTRGTDNRRQRGRRPGPPCYAWNDGHCTYSNCRFEHVCSSCQGNHRRSACRARAGDSNQGPSRGREEMRKPEKGKDH